MTIIKLAVEDDHTIRSEDIKSVRWTKGFRQMQEERRPYCTDTILICIKKKITGEKLSWAIDEGDSVWIDAEVIIETYKGKDVGMFCESNRQAKKTHAILLDILANHAEDAFVDMNDWY